LEISIASVVRTAILGPEKSVLSYSYLNAAAISIATTSLSILMISILIFSYCKLVRNSMRKCISTSKKFHVFLIIISKKKHKF